jgi:glycosyltransferase involved in cell wall biosynthesis
MKKQTLFLALVLTLGSIGTTFYFFKGEKKTKKGTAPTIEKPFTVIIPSYNNSRFCEANLRSVLEQRYENFRVIYIDDCSSDNTAEKVAQIVARSPRSDKVTLIRNQKNQGALANLYQTIHACADNEIVVTVDGDDALAHPGVLERLNKSYADPDVWMTYGNYLDYPSYKQKPIICEKLPARVVAKNSFRSYKWVTSHLRTFYAGLFKQVKLEDLLLDGKFLPMGWDLAFMFPMLEMAGGHATFIRDILYLYNRENPISDHQVSLAKQQACANHVRSLPKYRRLTALNFEESRQESADLVVFSYNRPMQLYALLESASAHVAGCNTTTVIYRADDANFETGYVQVKNRFPDVRFLKQSENPNQDFAPLFFEATFNSPAPYVLFAVDDIIVKDAVDLPATIQEIKRTGAYGFYLGYGLHLNSCHTLNRDQPLPPHVKVGTDTFAWKFKDGVADWNYPNSVDMVVYKKSEIEKVLRSLTFTNPATLEGAWAAVAPMNRYGLFPSRSKLVNIPLNQVSTTYINRHMNAYTPKELLALFLANKKIDTSPLWQVENPARHTEYTLKFVQR